MLVLQGEILDPYIPPEGDGKASILSKQVNIIRELALNLNLLNHFLIIINKHKYFSNALEQGKKLFSKKFKHVREIRRADPTFDSETFAEQAQQIYIQAHNALQK